MPATKTKKLVFPNGEEVELFYIKVLADFLGRSSYTVRSWEIADVIPDSGFRDKYCRRLYTMEQIVMITTLAEKYKVNYKNINGPRSGGFIKATHTQMRLLKEKYAKMQKGEL